MNKTIGVERRKICIKVPDMGYIHFEYRGGDFRTTIDFYFASICSNDLIELVNTMERQGYKFRGIYIVRDYIDLKFEKEDKK